jgi:hypothetical protein
VKQEVLSAIRAAKGHEHGGGHGNRCGCPFGNSLLSCSSSDN